MILLFHKKRFSGFEDKESGVVEMMVGLGTTINSLDVMEFTVAYNNIFHVPETVTMYDGHYYYAKAKVISIY